MIVRPKIRKRLLPVNQFSRPGRKLVSVKGIVVHWTGNPGGTAEDHAQYFQSLANQNPNDDQYDRYAGAHYFVDIDGEVVQLVPNNEMAYHVGAKEYPESILEKFNTTYPNNCLIGIEMCHPDATGEFTNETYESTLHLIVWLLDQHDLTLSDVVRHYDVTGKVCPKYYVENDEAYRDFRDDLSSVQKRSALYRKKVTTKNISEYTKVRV